MRLLSLTAALILAFPAFPQAQSAASKSVIPMVDPVIDATGPFCYLSKPTLNIGMMGVAKGSQVTFDGAIYAGGAELCFFSGEPLKPAMARQKELLDGWIPVIRYGWSDGAVEFRVETFAAAHDDHPLSNTTNFVRVTATNRSARTATATLAAATRFFVNDHRFGYMKPYPFSPAWRYEMTRDCVIRDGRAILFFPPGGVREAVPGVPYTGPFPGARHQVSDRAEVGMVRYALRLAPGASRGLDFKMPSVPVPVSDGRQLQAIRGARFTPKKEATAAFWRRLGARGARVEIPEAKVMLAHRANLMYDWLAIWTRFNKYWVQGVNKTQYNWFWLRDGAYIVRCYDLWGHHDIARRCLEYFHTFQKPDGQFQSQEGQTDGFGQALYAIGQHALLTGDRDYARKAFSVFPPAIGWLRKARAAEPFHIMPATSIFDNEYVPGHLGGHNFWALAGTRTAARIARWIGRGKEAADFLAQYNDFRAAFLAKLEKECGTDRPIPPSFDTPGGQDWGNLLALFPGEVLAPDDARVSATLAKMRREKYAEGLMTYKGRLHHYLTVKSAQNFVVRGEQEEALRDFYAILLHTGSCHEMFEWEADPWGARDTGANYPPHGWGSAMFNTLLRNMLVMERGGDGGLNGRDLHLFGVISPEWGAPGRRVAFTGMPTEMGPVSAAMRFREDGATVRIAARWRREPVHVVVAVPYWADLQAFRSDAKRSRTEGRNILLSPDATWVSLKWKRRPVEPLSYEKAVTDYKAEYARRFAEYVRAGHKPVPVEAPALLTAGERAHTWNRVWGPEVSGIAVGKPVTTSGGTGAAMAVDGNAVDYQKSNWVAGPKMPQWLSVDLGETTGIARIQVFPMFNQDQVYQYKVEVSADGASWRVVGDKSTNEERAVPEGDTFRFAPVAARFVRVTMLKNKTGENVHLTELRVFGN